MNSQYLFGLVLALSCVGMIAVFYSLEGAVGIAFVVVPFAVLVSLLYIVLISGKNSFLSAVMVCGLIIKLFSAWFYTTLEAFKLADVHLYFDTAQQLATTSTRLDQLFIQPFWGANFIISIGACLFAVIGPSLVGAMVLFALVSFWGQYFFYRAFVLAFPTANRNLAALLLFFCPSIVFWTAALGKDALMLFAISLISYGIARRYDVKGWAAILIGLSLSSLIRPHIGALLAISFFMSFLVTDVAQGRRVVGLKFMLFPIILAASLAIIVYSRDSLELNSVEDAQALSEHSYTYNQIGGSAFGADQSVQARLAQAPLLMFRPFPWEANNVTAALASCESVLLFIFVLCRRANLSRLLANIRSIPLVAFTLCFFVAFSVVFSISISNLGLLARMRVMVLPLVLMLLVASASFVKRPKVSLRHLR